MRTLLVSLAVLMSATIQGQSPALQRGEFVRVKPSASSSDTQTTLPLKIVALPNDRIRLDDSGIYVNDVPVSGFSRDFITRVVRAPQRTPEAVPSGHYFVMGEQRNNQDISEYWGIHPEARLERVR
jgi:signal peptidase I